jgi:sugar-specific transcriptional regulator TrmB
MNDLTGFAVDPTTKAVVRTDGGNSPLKILSRRTKDLQSKVVELEERLRKLEELLNKNEVTLDGK